jgi:hypothetical protein
MIIAAALLASGQVLPSIDRAWLNQQVRLEAAASRNPRRPLKSAPPAPPARPGNERKLLSYENTTGM